MTPEEFEESYLRVVDARRRRDEAQRAYVRALDRRLEEMRQHHLERLTPGVE